MLIRNAGRICRALTLATLVASVASTANATIPEVTLLEPRGVVRGEESVVKFRGNRLSDASQVLCDLPGIEILEVKPINNSEVEVKIKAAADLTPGLYPLRLVTKSGIANLRLLGVGSMPIVTEAEPNDEFDAPQAIELNSTVEGIVKREDVDHYQVKLAKGQTLNVEIEGLRLAFSLQNRDILDPYIAILDSGRFEVASSDDSDLLQQDGMCSYTAPEDGTYTILVRESSFQGSDSGTYRLHVGTFPRPVTVIPAGGQPASELNAQLIMSDGTERSAMIPLPSESQEQWGVVTQDDTGVTPSPNWVRVNNLPVVMEQEPNDDRAKAPLSEVPAAYCGVIGQADDFDCFAFEAKKGTRYRVEVFARNVLRSPLDAVINVFAPDNSTIVSNDDSRGRIDPFLEFDAKDDGPHKVRIYDHLRSGGPTYNYRIEVSTPPPSVSLTLKELRRDEAQVVAVPIGGRSAMMVSVNRDRYGGPVELSLDGLPAGVTATAFPIPNGRPEAPVVFTAAADAGYNASLYTVFGKGDENNPLVGGKLSQTHNMVLGQNRRPMWTYDTTRAAMAVTDPVPFEIELVQPQTPIVRDGSKNLLVRIKRNEGFEENVALRTLYNPPGIGINNGRSIPKGQSEVEIPITANGGAGVGEWPIIFMAYYNTPNGQAVTATPPINLVVESQLFKYDFPKSAGELGADVAYALPVETLREFEGEAEVQLVGLPAGVTCEAPTQPIPAGAESVTFQLKITNEAKVGLHKTLNAQSRVTVNGEVIVQTNGTGELRIDQPLPPKVDEPAKPEPPKAEAPKPAAPKPLSRLEQLRQEKNQ
ncbi:pre-peptidase C-terminal domain-containing protein [Rhodopirellula sp. MGV]|uniref:pre-peptidase C-terminal domain-containing protein n=1 Tax=Rhodopirellula sp. MGV TaxID=2023130 RepID=UPI000B95F485|nr:pre-peptidase C-terminal domain-containing protein [Rhodopirellula sp. MGV]OYP34475.1 serine protease [Rhodopirellula sp. MGV]PNY37498.1 serine protease [Rhodopirellula baltica]